MNTTEINTETANRKSTYPETPGLRPSRLHLLPRSISARVFLALLIFILPLNALALGISELALRNVHKQTENSVRTVIQNHISSTESDMEHMVALLYSIRTNDANARTVTYQAGDEKYKMACQLFYQSFKSTLQTVDTADGTFMYMGSLDDLLIWNVDDSIHSDNDFKDFIRGIYSEGTDMRGWHLCFLNGEYRSGEEYPLLVYITSQGTLYTGGWYEISHLEQELSDDLAYQTKTVLVTAEEPEEADASVFQISEYFEKANVWVTVQLDASEVNGSAMTAYYWYRAFAIILLICVPFLYLLLRKWMIRPLLTINRAHAEVEKGNLDYRIEETAGSAEYQKAFDSFNRMSENLKNLTIDNYEKELKAQQMEYKNLQLQIRPHFLLNIFNMIYNMAQEKEISHVQQTILYLSDYFRYIFRSGKDLELFGKEAGMIREYITTAQFRYPGCIEAEYDYDPEIMYIRIPPLLLHNFVENIIKHVVRQGTVTHILVEGHYENGIVTFHIMDDGEGIPEEQVKELNDYIHSGQNTGRHVGMVNSWLRLKHFYGEASDVVISSDPGIGTDVQITFPYDLNSGSLTAEV